MTAQIGVGGVTTRDHTGDETVSAINARVHQLFKAVRDRDGLPGMNIAFVLPDGREGTTSVGYSDLEKHIPMKTSDRMFSGSTGKTFVSAVVMQLVDKGKLNRRVFIETLE